MALPLMLALGVGLGLPTLGTMQTLESAVGADHDEALARDCEASHRAMVEPAVRGDTSARAQSPAWQQEHRTAAESCLRDGLPVMHTARGAP